MGVMSANPGPGIQYGFISLYGTQNDIQLTPTQINFNKPITAGAATFSGGTTFSGALNIFTNDVQIAGELLVNEDVTLNGSLTAAAAATFSGNTTFNGTTDTFNGTIIVNSDFACSGIITSEDAIIQDDLFVEGDLLVQTRNVLNDIGVLSNLTTTNKTNLVSAINEVKSSSIIFDTIYPVGSVYSGTSAPSSGSWSLIGLTGSYTDTYGNNTYIINYQNTIAQCVYYIGSPTANDTHSASDYCLTFNQPNMIRNYKLTTIYNAMNAVQNLAITYSITQSTDGTDIYVAQSQSSIVKYMIEFNSTFDMGQILMQSWGQNFIRTYQRTS
jgi:hypothetical protein